MKYDRGFGERVNADGSEEQDELYWRPTHAKDNDYNQNQTGDSPLVPLRLFGHFTLKVKRKSFHFLLTWKSFGYPKEKGKITSDQLCSEKVFQVLKKFPVLTTNRLKNSSPNFYQ